MAQLHSDRLWNEIRQLANVNQPKCAAVAYVSSDAIVAFGSGDTLVTDASDEAVMSGQTRADVLEPALHRGAQLYSSRKLHAKVMVFGDTAIIGSSNISTHSATVLTEAAWITDQVEAVTASRTFIQSLILNAVPIESNFIQRIRRLPVRPWLRPSIEPPTAPSNIVLFFFKQALRGDLKKYQRLSATATTGGGARDLRVSPNDVYRPSLQQMLPHPSTVRLDVTNGPVHWRTSSGLRQALVELWPPTRQRPLELRLARWWSVGGWRISDATFNAEVANGMRLFYVLELDASGIVWARVVREADLHLEPTIVANQVRAQIQTTPPRNAATGLIDLSTGLSLP